MGKLYYTMILVLTLILSANHHLSAQCTTIAGQPYPFSMIDHDIATDSSEIYVLTDFSGVIQIVSDTSAFNVAASGLYNIYGFIYKTDEGIQGVEVGNSYSDITGSFVEIGVISDVVVCSQNGICDTFDGSLDFNSVGENTSLTTVFILTNLNQQIIMTSNLPNFTGVAPGDYFIFPVNYADIEGLTISNHISDITGTCFEIGNPLMISSCSPCSITLNDDIEICEGQVVVLTADSDPVDGNFVWSSGQTGSSIAVAPTVSTDYIATFTAANGCTANASVHVAVQEKPAVDLGADKSICEGESVILEIEPVVGGTYMWNTGATTNIITVSPSATTSYSIQVTKGICTVHDNIVVNVNPFVEAAISGANYVCKGESDILTASGGDFYLWSTGATTASIMISPDETTTYSVTVTNINGCSSEADITIYTDQCGKIGNLVWDDLNGNGLKDSGEPGISGVTVHLYHNDTQIASSTTNAQGQYQFEGLAAGDYRLRFIAPNGFIGTVALSGNDNMNSDIDPETGFTALFNLDDQEAKLNVFAGFIKPGIMSHYVWEDMNANGIQDDDEPGIEGINILLEGTDGKGTQVNTSVVTDANGTYQFDALYPGIYTVSFLMSDNYKVSPNQSGTDNKKDSDISTTGTITNIVVTSGFESLNLDAGIYRCGKISGHVWVDKGDESDIYDSDDELMNGVEVQLFHLENKETPIQTTLTSTIGEAEGRYEFEVCSTGYYYIKVIRPKDYKFVSPMVGNGLNDSKISDSISGKSDSFYLGYAHLIVDMDAGLVYSPLAVELVEFSGYWNVVRDVNALKWIANAEINNDYFELERSYELEPFDKIAFIKGKGNTNVRQEYGYDDSDIQRNGVYNYRLKQVDFDGQYRYSNIVKIPVYREVSGFTTALYPNPTEDKSTLEIHASKGMKINVEIYDGVGRLCHPFVFNGVLETDVEKIPLDKIHLPKGMYHIKVSSDDQVSTLKWLIIK